MDEDLKKALGEFCLLFKPKPKEYATMQEANPTSPADREISVFQDFFGLFSDVSRWLMVGGLAFQASNAV